jgi:hypothetical protein
MNANYSLSVWYELPNSKLYYGQWQCRITFAYPGLGNTGEGERIASNAIRSAKRAIRDAVISQNLCDMIETKLAKAEWRDEVFPKRLAYEVVSNETQLGTGQLKTLTIAIKQNEGK